MLGGNLNKNKKKNRYEQLYDYMFKNHPNDLIEVKIPSDFVDDNTYKNLNIEAWFGSFRNPHGIRPLVPIFISNTLWPAFDRNYISWSCPSKERDGFQVR